MHRRTLLRSSAAAALAALVLAPAAQAKVTAADVISSPRAGSLEPGDPGEVVLQLSGGAKGKLSKAGVKISGSGDTAVKGAKVTLLATPTGTLIDPITMKGSLATAGGITFRRGGRSAKLTKLTLEPGTKKKQVTAKLGSKTVRLGTITGGKGGFTPYANGNLKNATLKLSSSGAKALSKAVGGGFSAGTFAKVNAAVIMAQFPLTSGTGTLRIDEAFAGLLAQNGIALVGGSGATVSGTTVTLPLIGGAFDPERLTGRLSFGGQVQVTRGGDTIRLFEFASAIGSGQRDVFAKFNANASAAIGTADVSQMEATMTGVNFTATNTVIALSQIAMQSIKASFNLDVPAGTKLGVIDIAGITPAGE